MLTYTGARNLYGSLTNNKSSDNLSLGDTFINQFTKELIESRDWDFRETTSTFSTVASTQFYDLPSDFGKLIDVFVTIGSTKYIPKVVTSKSTWDIINQNSNTTSSYPEWYYIFNGQIGFYPTPSGANTVTINYLRKVNDLSIADYTTGTVTTATNGDATIVGSGTTWTSAMIGRYMKIDASGGGDNQWYKIESITSTTELELTRNYQGTSLAAGSATYTIGEATILPESFQVLPIYRACEHYFASVQPEPQRAKYYFDKYQEGIKNLMIATGEKTTGPILEDIRWQTRNPNLYLESTNS